MCEPSARIVKISPDVELAREKAILRPSGENAGLRLKGKELV